eukprot:1440349-Rhodomonas_salina.2
MDMTKHCAAALGGWWFGLGFGFGHVNKNKLLSHVWQSEEMWWPLGAAVAVDAKVEIAIAKNMHPSSQRFILAPRRATTRDGAIFA